MASYIAIWTISQPFWDIKTPDPERKKISPHTTPFPGPVLLYLIFFAKAPFFAFDAFFFLCDEYFSKE